MTARLAPIAVASLLAVCAVLAARAAAAQDAVIPDFGILAPGISHAPAAGPAPAVRGFSPDMLQIIDGGYQPLRQMPGGAVESDRSLRPGDIIVTIDGLKVFRGWSEGAQAAFVPLSDAALPVGERALLTLIDRQVRGENGANARVSRQAPPLPPRPLVARPAPVSIIDERFLR